MQKLKSRNGGLKMEEVKREQKVGDGDLNGWTHLVHKAS